jgi:hypothetical protein
MEEDSELMAVQTRRRCDDGDALSNIFSIAGAQAGRRLGSRAVVTASDEPRILRPNLISPLATLEPSTFNFHRLVYNTHQQRKTVARISLPTLMYRHMCHVFQLFFSSTRHAKHRVTHASSFWGITQ